MHSTPAEFLCHRSGDYVTDGLYCADRLRRVEIEIFIVSNRFYRNDENETTKKTKKGIEEITDEDFSDSLYTERGRFCRCLLNINT